MDVNECLYFNTKLYIDFYNFGLPTVAFNTHQVLKETDVLQIKTRYTQSIYKIAFPDGC